MDVHVLTLFSFVLLYPFQPSAAREVFTREYASIFSFFFSWLALMMMMIMNSAA